jgi:hypothetical protein
MIFRARVNALLIVLRDGPCEKWENGKMGDLSDFERGRIVGAGLAGASVTKIATLLDV